MAKEPPAKKIPEATLTVTVVPEKAAGKGGSYFHVMIANCDSLESRHMRLHLPEGKSDELAAKFTALPPGRYYVFTTEAGNDKDAEPTFVYVKEDKRNYQHKVPTKKKRPDTPPSSIAEPPFYGKITATVLVNGMRSPGKTIVITAMSGPAAQYTAMTDIHGEVYLDDLPNTTHEITAYCPPHAPQTQSYIVTDPATMVLFEFPSVTTAFIVPV